MRPLSPLSSAVTAEGARHRLDQAQQPLYVSLSNLLETEIYEGRWRSGAQLPTIAELSDKYQVARVTIRQALGVLSTKGLIASVQGKGTFVAENVIPKQMVELDSDWHHLLAMLDGNLPEPIEIRKTCDLPASLNGTGAGTSLGDYRYMRRIHRNHGQPYCVNEVYLANDFYKRSPKAFDTQMIIPNLTKITRTKLKRLRQSVRITSADLFIAQSLNVPLNAPVAEVKRLITNRKDEIVYYGIGQYRGDLVVFNTTIDVPD
ncbi:MAG: GntR family transcriptional regulator [Bradyrhizobiaceae bacterium]|nr:MAG: GntR family transcriptional regulator [Bradyrhizobiaceae bacterium]